MKWVLFFFSSTRGVKKVQNTPFFQMFPWLTPHASVQLQGKGNVFFKFLNWRRGIMFPYVSKRAGTDFEAR
jgi:hypothetical protein